MDFFFTPLDKELGVHFPEVTDMVSAYNTHSRINRSSVKRDAHFVLFKLHHFLVLRHLNSGTYIKTYKTYLSELPSYCIMPWENILYSVI